MKRTIEIRSIQIYNIDRMDLKKGHFLTLSSNKHGIHCASNKNKFRGIKKGRSILKQESFTADTSKTQDIRLMLRKGDKVQHHHRRHRAATEEIKQDHLRRSIQNKGVDKGRYHTNTEQCLQISKQQSIDFKNESHDLRGAGGLHTIQSAKNTILNRISHKIQMFKRLNPEVLAVSNEESTFNKINIFKFQKLYDHCVKNISRDVKELNKTPQKNEEGPKESSYYKKKKLQNQMIAKEIGELRKTLIKKKQECQASVTNRDMLGVVGSSKQINIIESKKDQQNHNARNDYSQKKRVCSAINAHRAPTYSLSGSPRRQNNDLKCIEGWECAPDLYLE